MGDKTHRSSSFIQDNVAPVLLNLPWVEIVAEVWKSGRKVLRGMANEGMYEVLENESTLELRDKKGQKAGLKKRKKTDIFRTTSSLIRIRPGEMEKFSSTIDAHPVLRSTVIDQDTKHIYSFLLGR